MLAMMVLQVYSLRFIFLHQSHLCAVAFKRELLKTEFETIVKILSNQFKRTLAKSYMTVKYPLQSRQCVFHSISRFIYCWVALAGFYSIFSVFSKFVCVFREWNKTCHQLVSSTRRTLNLTKSSQSFFSTCCHSTPCPFLFSFLILCPCLRISLAFYWKSKNKSERDIEIETN